MEASEPTRMLYIARPMGFPQLSSRGQAWKLAVESFFCSDHSSPRQTATHETLSLPTFLSSSPVPCTSSSETSLDPLFWKLQFPSSAFLGPSLAYSVPGTICLAKFTQSVILLWRPKLVSFGSLIYMAFLTPVRVLFSMQRFFHTSVQMCGCGFCFDDLPPHPTPRFLMT